MRTCCSVRAPALARRAAAFSRRRVGEQEYSTLLSHVHPSCLDSARNLVHYLVLRSADRRELQSELQSYGLSSLGSLEAHVLPTLEAVTGTLDAMRGIPGCLPKRADFEKGSTLLLRNADRALGPSPSRHRTRVMVTAPPEAATDKAVLAALLEGKMNILRINSAHDGKDAWRNMVDFLHVAEAERRRGGAEVGARTRVQFDLAGPKLRTGGIVPQPARARWAAHDGSSVVLRLEGADHPEDAPSTGLHVPLAAGDASHHLLSSARVGDTLRLEDARGRIRELHVTDIGTGRSAWLSAACDKRGVLAPRLRLELLRRKVAFEPSSADAQISKKQQKQNKKKEDILMSLAVAKVGALPMQPGFLLLRTGETVSIRLGEFDGTPAPEEGGGEAILSIALPEVFFALRVGHRVCFDDGKFVGVVLSTNGRDEAQVRLVQVVGGACKLASEKGINLPDSPLSLPALTEDDLADLKHIIPLKPDIIALSFTQTPRDVLDLQAALDAAGPAGAACCVLLKIETAAAFQALPMLLLTAMRRPNCAVMLARGDLAVEVGFARLSEVQEELLWLCEAAHVPVVWATQVLESMAKTGSPSRGEVTDAAMAGRAEAVMLNKGPFMPEVLSLLE